MLERGDPSQALQLKELQAAAPRLALTIVPVDVQAWDEPDLIFRTKKNARAETLVGLGEPLSSHLKKIAQFCSRTDRDATVSPLLQAHPASLPSYNTSVALI